MKTKDARSKKYLSNYLLRSNTKVFVGIKTYVNMYVLPTIYQTYIANNILNIYCLQYVIHICIFQEALFVGL